MNQQDSARVAFGPGPDQNIPVSWAERILIALAASSPQVFGRLLRQVVLADLNGGTTPQEGDTDE
jgi:hypothetical protein